MNGPCTLSDEQVQFAGMRSSHLVLKADGTYEQHHELANRLTRPKLLRSQNRGGRDATTFVYSSAAIGTL
jgi:hypothetical protein